MAAPFDWKHPDYTAVFSQRARMLAYMQDNPDKVPGIHKYYTDHPAEFISAWGMTYDPRNPEVGLPSRIPFILFPRQVEWVEWFLERWTQRENGIVPKSRELGMSWLAIATVCTLCLFREGLTFGFGSQVRADVDNSANPDSLFWKARFFLESLPREFTGGWNREDNSIDMQLRFPLTNSIITGDCGDNIGRGGRTSATIIDEAAHLERPDMVEASLMATTNCRIDISSVKGVGNPFAQKMLAGNVPMFLFNWRSDPRKDDAWYAKMCTKFDAITIAQEVDIDLTASREGIIIPAIWARAAVDAHKKLGIEPSGARHGSLDVADQGKDLCAFAGAHGQVVEYVETWKGLGSDIFGTVQKAFHICDTRNYESFVFDGDGLGAGVRGDARVINEGRGEDHGIMVTPFIGSSSPTSGRDVPGRRNKDFFANRKAQAWWGLRVRFEKTYKWVVNGTPCDPDEIISLSSGIPKLQELLMELSQPTFKTTATGKMLVDKAPDGAKSPNCFVAGTLVATPRGLIAIENLGVGDSVITPMGVSKIIYAHKNYADEIYTAEGLTGTPEHRVFTWNKGWVPLRMLSCCDTLEYSGIGRIKWRIMNRFYTKARCSQFSTQVDTIAQEGTEEKILEMKDFYTGGFGLSATAKFLTSTTYTTLTGTGGTIVLKILNVFSGLRTVVCTCLKGLSVMNSRLKMRSTWKKLSKNPETGTGLQKVWHGTRNMAQHRGSVESTKRTYAACAGVFFNPEKAILQAPAVESARAKLATLKRKSNTCPNAGIVVGSSYTQNCEERTNTGGVPVSAPSGSERTAVYNITLDAHNAYYANGRLVRNCGDAINMLFAEAPTKSTLLQLPRDKCIVRPRHINLFAR